MEIRNQVQNHEARKWQSSAELDSILIQSCVLTPHWTMFWMGWGTTPRVPGVPSPAVGATGRDRNWCPARVTNGEECPWSKQEKTDLQNTRLRVHAHACAHTRYSCHYGSFTCRFFTFVCQNTRDRKDLGDEDRCEPSWCCTWPDALTIKKRNHGFLAECYTFKNLLAISMTRITVSFLYYDFYT